MTRTPFTLRVASFVFFILFMTGCKERQNSAVRSNSDSKSQSAFALDALKKVYDRRKVIEKEMKDLKLLVGKRVVIVRGRRSPAGNDSASSEPFPQTRVVMGVFSNVEYEEISEFGYIEQNTSKFWDFIEIARMPPRLELNTNSDLNPGAPESFYRVPAFVPIDKKDLEKLNETDPGIYIDEYYSRQYESGVQNPLEVAVYLLPETVSESDLKTLKGYIKKQNEIRTNRPSNKSSLAYYFKESLAWLDANGKLAYAEMTPPLRRSYVNLIGDATRAHRNAVNFDKYQLGDVVPKYEGEYRFETNEPPQLFRGEIRPTLKNGGCPDKVVLTHKEQIVEDDSQKITYKVTMPHLNAVSSSCVTDPIGVEVSGASDVETSRLAFSCHERGHQANVEIQLKEDLRAFMRVQFRWYDPRGSDYYGYGVGRPVASDLCLYVRPAPL